MLIFLYGKDSYRRQKKLNGIIEEYRKRHSNLSLAYFDLENQDEFSWLKEFSSQMLIFDNKKLAILKNAFAIDIKELREFLKKYLGDQDLTILISEETCPPELKSVLKKAFLSDEIKPLKDDEWKFFIQKEAKQRDINLTSQAIIFLARTFKDDTWGLINELDKISLLTAQTNADLTLTNADSQRRPAIDVSDFKKIGDYNNESSDIYGFINAVSGNWPLTEKIISLEKLFIANEEPTKIFNYMASSRYLPLGLIKKLADYDVMVKSGKIDYEEILVDLALSG